MTVSSEEVYKRGWLSGDSLKREQLQNDGRRQHGRERKEGLRV